jgi:hypothetical protein
MKIALIFSGIPRYLHKSSLNIKRTLIQNHDVDIFSYVWKTSEFEYLNYVYNHTVLQTIDFKIVEKLPASRHNIFSHWFGKQFACHSFREFVQATKRSYDFIVRTRHDICFYNNIHFEKLNPELLNVSLKHWNGHPTPIFDDNLMITSQQNYFNFYGDIFDWYSGQTTNNFEDISEEKLTEFAFNKNVFPSINKSSIIDFELTKHTLEGNVL